MTTKAFALIDRKTKKIVWVGLEKPKKMKWSGAWKAYFSLLFHPRTFRTLTDKSYTLIPVTITPKRKAKKKRV